MQRASGVLMPISCLPGRYSIGGFGEEARRFVDRLAQGGFSYWQVLPLCMTDASHSPYASPGAFSMDPNYIDLPTLYGEGLLRADEVLPAEQRQSHLCEYARLENERLDLLALAAQRYGKQREMTDFFDTHPHVLTFCRFMAHRYANGGAPFSRRLSARCGADVCLLFCFCEYKAYTQWRALKAYANARGVRIIGDVPFYVARDSADVFSEGEGFLLDARGDPTAVAGVPPDGFAPDGQIWGTPLYRWGSMRADGYGWWRARMGYMAELFDGIRLDHFRAAASYYEIPVGATTAARGRWRRGPGRSFCRALREAAADRLLIAEDLGGEGDADVCALRTAMGWPGMRVLQFGFLQGGEMHLPHSYPESCVCYTGTHDNDTLLGYVWSLDGEARRRLFDYVGYTGARWDTAEAYRAVIRAMLASHAGLCIFPVQDLLHYGSDTRINIPGTASGNWRPRLTEQQLDSIDLAYYRAQNALYGRICADREPDDRRKI